MKQLLFQLFLGALIAFPAKAQSVWPGVTNTAKPWTRWWWMGSAVNANDLRSNLTHYANAGIGGVEIVPVYGAKGYEPSYIPYLSPQWMQMLDSSIAIARSLNMGVDMAAGTGWPIGGPQVTMKDAASKLHIQQYRLQEGETLKEKITINDPKQQGIEAVQLQALMAYGKNNQVLDISGKLLPDGTLQWTAPEGNWDIYAAFVAKTLQKVKRAAPGGEGFTFDHFSTNALSNYFKKYDTAYGNKNPAIRSYFNDSYELFGANWSPTFFEEFKKRRGYDLKKYIREFNSNDSTPLMAKIKCDYRETMADLMLENFSKRFTAWAHSKNALSTNQAHGSPGNLLDLYAAVDIAETETFGSSYFPIPGLRRDTADIQDVDPDPIMMKFPSSAANAVGHKLVSCETFTWLTEHFKTSWAQCKPEVEKIFLSGVNHVFYHGSTYSPAEARWPGWLFYASVNFVPGNSLWPHLKELSNYITRCQSVLQAGKPDNDIMLYWPVFDEWQKAKGKDMPFRIHNIDDWLQPTDFYTLAKELQQKGYTADYVSDKMISQAFVDKEGLHVTDSGAVYKTIVVPSVKIMPLETLQQLYSLAENGATVIFQSLPESVPGLHNFEQRQKAFDDIIAGIFISNNKKAYSTAVIGKGKFILSPGIETALSLVAVQRETLQQSGLQFIRRRSGDDHWYYIVNHSAANIDTTVSLQQVGNFFYLLDPQTGKQGLVNATIKNGQASIRLQLNSGEAIFTRLSQKRLKTTVWEYRPATKKTIQFNNSWQVTFTEGGPKLPAARTISQLTSWTTWNDTALNNFSGTAVYSYTLVLKAKQAKRYILDLGKVCESAKVFINGKEAGTAWSIPYQLEVGSFLKPGINQIKIEVANLMANRIHYMDKNNIPWRNYHEINFVNIRYKNFDASGWPLQPSGLLGPVVIRY